MKTYYALNARERKCSVEGCDKKHEARNLCSEHYHRSKRQGVFTTKARPLTSVEWLEALHEVIGFTPNKCVLWPFSTDKDGYGRLIWQGKYTSAHRTSLIMATGEDPPRSVYACHGPCHNPLCINPHHLRWGSNSDNQLDRRRDGTAFTGEKHPGSKLTSEQILAIREDPRVQYEIAADYSISQSHIHRIKTRQKWKHL